MASINTEAKFHGAFIEVRIQFGMKGLLAAFDNDGLIALAKAEAGLYLPTSAQLHVEKVVVRDTEEETNVVVHMTRND